MGWPYSSWPKASMCVFVWLSEDRQAHPTDFHWISEVFGDSPGDQSEREQCSTDSSPPASARSCAKRLPRHRTSQRRTGHAGNASRFRKTTWRARSDPGTVLRPIWGAKTGLRLTARRNATAVLRKQLPRTTRLSRDHAILTQIGDYFLFWGKIVRLMGFNFIYIRITKDFSVTKMKAYV